MADPGSAFTKLVTGNKLSGRALLHKAFTTALGIISIMSVSAFHESSTLKYYQSPTRPATLLANSWGFMGPNETCTLQPPVVKTPLDLHNLIITVS